MVAADLGPCVFCGRPSRGLIQVVVYQQLRRSLPCCTAHAACLATEELVLTLRCGDTLWRARAPGLVKGRT